MFSQIIITNLCSVVQGLFQSWSAVLKGECVDVIILHFYKIRLLTLQLTNHYLFLALANLFIAAY